MNNRIQELQKILKEKRLDAAIVTNPVNIFYLTGFKGVIPTEREAILIFSPRLHLVQGVTLTKPVLITAQLYQHEASQVASRALKVKIAAERNQMLQLAQRLLTKAARIGFEENDLKYGEYQEFKKALSNLGSGRTLKKLVPFRNLIEDLRSIKTQDEIKKIAKAQIISQKALAQLVKTLKVGQVEEEIAERLSKIIKSEGGHGLAFESIIASGPNSGKPHHVTSNKRLTKNDILLFDFGAKYNHYCADLSRTIFIGKATDDQKNVYWHVHQAQKLALGKITSGIKSVVPHNVVMGHFKKHRLHHYFLHGLGHGVGLEVHEKPHLRPSFAPLSGTTEGKPASSVSQDEEEILAENMVFSVEPGLYFPWGGVRIEDLVVIANGKAKVLGKLTEEIIEI